MSLDPGGDTVLIGNTDGTKIGNIGDRLRVSTSNANSFFLDISKGLVTGHSTIIIAGFNPAVGTTQEDIWDAGGTQVQPASASVLDISSANANDTSAGTGARTLLVEGLDSSYDEQSETITMNGTSTVQTVNTYLRFRKAVNVTAGTTLTNEGLITITHNTSALVMGNIIVGKGSTESSVFTIPNGKTAFVLGAFFGNSGGQTVVITLKVRPQNEAEFVGNTIEIGNTPFNLGLSVTPRVILEKTDIKLSAETQTGNSSVSGTLQMILVDN